MIDDPLAALEEEFGATVEGAEPYLVGKPGEYVCDEHGVQVLAVVYDPYDAPSYICKECGERLSMNKLE